MNKEGSLLITSSAEDPSVNLNEISLATSQRMEEIGSGKLRRSTLEVMDARLLAFTEKIEQIPLLDGENAAQRTERIGWMVQTAALEMLRDEEIGADPVKDAWRNELGMEILERRRAAGGNLPGIKVKFREPYGDGDYIDGWSTNAIQIDFTEKLQETDDFPVMLSLRHSDVFALSGPQRTKELLANYERLQPVGMLTALALLTELADVISGLKIKSPEYDREMLDKRFELLVHLIKNDNGAWYGLEVHHTLSGVHNQYHALVLKLKKSFDPVTYYSVNTQVQPEDVNDEIWEYLGGLNVEQDAMPSRLECARLAERIRDSGHYDVGDYGDEDGGGSRRRPDGWKRKRRGKRYGGN